MGTPDYREQARAALTKIDERCAFEWTEADVDILASWASRIAEERDAILREALSKNGPRAHADFCEDGCCWMCRGRRLLGEGR